MDVYKIIAPQLLTAWERLSKTAQPTKINGRWVKLNIRAFSRNELDRIVIMQARPPFSAWPLGDWVVVEGWNRMRECVWTPLATEELEKAW